MCARIHRNADINGKLKWAVNAILDKDSIKIPSDNGYYGKYTVITYGKKKAIVFVDDRDAKVKVCTGWFDEIFYGGVNIWSGDRRDNHDKPILVKNRSKYNIVKAHDGKLLCNEWFSCKTINPVWRWNKEITYHMIGFTKNYEKFFVMKNGNIIFENSMSSESNLFADVKTWTNEKITEEWINKGKPCAHIHGLEYKGAHAAPVTVEKAKELWKTHHSFNTMFESAEWIMMNGYVTLLFRDYAGSDYD